MRRPIFHVIGDRVILATDVLRVEWNSKGMLVATSLGNRVLRGQGLLQLLPDFLWRRPLICQVGTRIEPNAPVLNSNIEDIRSAPDLPVSTQTIPDLLLDLPGPFVGFQSLPRLTVARWDDVMAAGWRGKGFWFALPDIAYLVTPPAEIPKPDRMPFLTGIVAARMPNHFAAGLSASVVQQYVLHGRYSALTVEPIQLEALINDPTAIRGAIVLSPAWQQTVTRSRAPGMSLGD